MCGNGAVRRMSSTLTGWRSASIVSKHTLVCAPNASGKPSVDGAGLPGGGKVGPDGMHSGTEECKDNPDCVDTKDNGPIKPDRYKMNADTRPEHAGWGMYRLEPSPHRSGMDLPSTTWAGGGLLIAHRRSRTDASMLTRPTLKS